MVYILFVVLIVLLVTALPPVSKKSGRVIIDEGTLREITVWKTIRLGICKTPDEYRKALEKAGCRVISLSWGYDALDKADCTQEEIEIDLVVMSAKELGFVKGAPYRAILARCVQVGLELCPAEVGPALRLAYGDQPRGEQLRIATKEVTNSAGHHDIFAVTNERGVLCLTHGADSIDFYTDEPFVFVRRRKKILAPKRMIRARKVVISLT